MTAYLIFFFPGKETIICKSMVWSLCESESFLLYLDTKNLKVNLLLYFFFCELNKGYILRESEEENSNESEYESESVRGRHTVESIDADVDGSGEANLLADEH